MAGSAPAGRLSPGPAARDPVYPAHRDFSWLDSADQYQSRRLAAVAVIALGGTALFRGLHHCPSAPEVVCPNQPRLRPRPLFSLRRLQSRQSAGPGGLSDDYRTLLAPASPILGLGRWLPGFDRPALTVRGNGMASHRPDRG